MIPAPESELTKINIEGITDIAYKTLLQKQVQFIRKNQDDILKKHANVVYVNRKRQNGYWLHKKCNARF